MCREACKAYKGLQFGLLPSGKGIVDRVSWIEWESPLNHPLYQDLIHVDPRV